MKTTHNLHNLGKKKIQSFFEFFLSTQITCMIWCKRFQKIRNLHGKRIANGHIHFQILEKFMDLFKTSMWCGGLEHGLKLGGLAFDSNNRQWSLDKW